MVGSWRRNKRNISAERAYYPACGKCRPYVLKIFEEEVNDELYTDFCSEPVHMNLDVTNGTGTIKDFDNIHEHKAGAEWKHNETSHWNECMNNCGEKLNEAPHSYEWVIDKEATATEAGSKHEECIVCGYEKAAVEIPATGTTGPANPNESNEPSGPSDPSAPPENPDDNSNNPQTGDSSNLVLPIFLLFVSGIGLAGTSICLKKRRYSK